MALDATSCTRRFGTVGRRGRRSEAGFTIMEILIAIVILVVGITGIVALFPTAIESGNKTVEDTIAASTTQSVMDGIAVGIRESRFTEDIGGGNIWSWFVFQHDGVALDVDVDPQDYAQASQHDWCVLLPTAAANTDPIQEPIYIYPVPLTTGGGVRGRPPNPVSDITNVAAGGAPPPQFLETFDSTAALPRYAYEYTRVYHLGRKSETVIGNALGYRGDPYDPTAIRDEFLSIDTIATSGERAIVDPYPQYSFAFSIQRAKIDTNGNGTIDGADEFSSSLFEVRIAIFRNFQVTAGAGGGGAAALRLGGTTPRIPKQNLPIHQFITLISI